MFGLRGGAIKLLKNISIKTSLPLANVFKNVQLQESFHYVIQNQLLYLLPLHKISNINNCTKYGPITLISTIFKLLENVLKLPTEFLDKTNLFNKNQYGFRNNLSTNYTLYYSTRIIYDKLD